jgi:hypothetical protein
MLFLHSPLFSRSSLVFGNDERKILLPEDAERIIAAATKNNIFAEKKQ